MRITSAPIRHLYRNFQFGPEDDHVGLLVDADLTDQLAPIIAERPAVAAAAKAVLAGPGRRASGRLADRVDLARTTSFLEPLVIAT